MNQALFSYGETSNPDVFRYINHEGDWDYYYIKSLNVFVPAVSRILHVGLPKGFGFVQYLLSVTKEESEKILNTTGERGTRIHSAVRMLINGETLTMDTLLPNNLTGRPERLTFDEWLALLSFQSFCQKYNPKNFFTEKTVASADLGFAGTIDWVCEIDEPKSKKRIKALLDFKTGGGPYLSQKCQVASYHALENDSTISHTGILRLGTSHKNGVMTGAGFQLCLWDDRETLSHLEAFKHAKGIHDIESDPFEKNGVEIPMSISLKIDKLEKQESPLAIPVAKDLVNSKPKRKRKTNVKPIV